MVVFAPQYPPPVAIPRLVGRDRELAQLRHAVAGGAVVLVEGEAGAGKTRLVRELIASAPPSHRFAVGACPPFREAPALGPVAEAIQYTAASLSDTELSPLVGALHPLFPQWHTQLPPPPEPLGDAAAAQHRMFRALRELIGTLGVTVLVIEDVHWADTATLDFLLFLTARQTRPISVVVTYRSEDLPAQSALVRLSSRLRDTTARLRLQVRPLGTAAAGALISAMLGDEPVAPEFVDLLVAHTAGVPLALEESVRLLRDRAELVHRDQGWTRCGDSELPVPPTVRDAVLERVGRLDPAARRIVQASAVLAEPASEGLILAVAGLPEDRARAALVDVVDAGLLGEVAGARLAFRHVPVGRAIYHDTPAPVRRALHRRAGRALANQQPAPLLQLTRHFRAAADTARWQRYAEQAAAQACEHGDHSTATVVLSDLLASTSPAADSYVRLARQLVEAAQLRRDPVDDRHGRVVSIVRQLLDQDWLSPGDEAELRTGLGRLLAQRGDLTAARAELARAVPRLTDPGQAARAMAFLGVPFIGDQPATVHLRWLQRAAAIDATALSPVQRLAWTVDRASALLALGEPSGWQVADTIPADSPEPGERQQVTRAHLNVGTLAATWGHYGRARRDLRAALRLADSDRFLRVRERILAAMARLDWYVGAWHGLRERLAAITESDDERVTYLVMLRDGLLRLATGEVSAGERQCRHALELTRRVGTVNDQLEPAAAVARSRLVAGDWEEADKLTVDPMQTVASKDVWLWATDIAPVRMQVLVAQGANGEAAQLVAQFARGLGSRDAPAAQAALLACRAWEQLAYDRPDAAARGFAAAAAAWGRLPRPYDSALAREQQARSLLQAGQVRRGVDLLARTHQRLCTLGASGDAARVADALRGQGVEPLSRSRRGRKGYGDRLSPRELEVVRLVVTGATNRQIAEVLSRSPKTVATQLSSAMRKLQVSSRTALAVAAVDAGIVTDNANK